MKSLSSFFFLILFVTSCQLENNKTIVEVNKKITKFEKKIVKVEKKIVEFAQVNIIKEKKQNNTNSIFYLVGDPYFIQGVEYVPEENYSYNQSGLATFYDKELHKVKTANNDLNKVTELLGRHKTLPLPSIVKITNLENGLSLIIKINDRFEDNALYSGKSAMGLSEIQMENFKQRAEEHGGLSNQEMRVTNFFSLHRLFGRGVGRLLNLKETIE